MFADIVYQSGDQYLQEFEDIQAALLVFIPCFIGLLMAIIALYGCHKIPAMKSPFGYLTRYELYLIIIASSNSGGFYLFGVLFNIKFILNNSQIAGLISTTLIPTVISLYLLISFNRFLAIVTPLYYSIIFKSKYRRIYVSICYFVPLIYTPVFTWYYNCGYKFYHYGWVFSFIISDTCGTKFEVLLRGVQSLFTAATFSVNVCTFILLVFFRKRVLKTTSAEVRKREMNFGQQVIIQGFVFTIYGIFYSFAYRWIPGNLAENWKIFWTSTFIANSLHIFNAGMIFVFNAEFSKWISSGNKVGTASVSMVKPIA